MRSPSVRKKTCNEKSELGIIHLWWCRCAPYAQTLVGGCILRCLKYWLPPLLYVALIFSLSSLSKPPIPKLDWNASDKFYHAIEYAVLSFLLGQALVNTSSRLSVGFAGMIAMFVAVLLGASDEWYQSFVPGRFSTVSDWVADSLGGILGALLMYVWHWFRARRFR